MPASTCGASDAHAARPGGGAGDRQRALVQVALGADHGDVGGAAERATGQVDPPAAVRGERHGDAAYRLVGPGQRVSGGHPAILGRGDQTGELRAGVRCRRRRRRGRRGGGGGGRTGAVRCGTLGSTATDQHRRTGGEDEDGGNGTAWTHPLIVVDNRAGCWERHSRCTDDAGTLNRSNATPPATCLASSLGPPDQRRALREASRRPRTGGVGTCAAPCRDSARRKGAERRWRWSYRSTAAPQSQTRNGSSGSPNVSSPPARPATTWSWWSPPWATPRTSCSTWPRR